MTRVLVLCLSVTLVAACKKSNPEPVSPAREPAAAPVASDTAGTVEPAAAPQDGSDELTQEVAEHDAKQEEAEPDETHDKLEHDEDEDEDDDEHVEKLELKASMVDPFMAYRSATLAAVTKASKAESGSSREEMSNEIAEALTKSGLTETQVDALDEVSNEVLSSRRLAAAVAKVEADEGSAPPERLAAEVRAKYGDEVVDAMVERAEELQRLEREEDLLAQANERELMMKKQKMILLYETHAAGGGEDWGYFTDEVEQHFKTKNPAVEFGSIRSGAVSPVQASYLRRKLKLEGFGYVLINGSDSLFIRHNQPNEIITQAREFFKL